MLNARTLTGSFDCVLRTSLRMTTSDQSLTTAYQSLTTNHFLLALSLRSSANSAQGYDAAKYLYFDMS